MSGGVWSNGILSEGDFVLVYNMIVSQIIPRGLCTGGILSTMIYFKNPFKMNYKKGILSRGDFVKGDFVHGGFYPKGFCPGGFW